MKGKLSVILLSIFSDTYEPSTPPRDTRFIQPTCSVCDKAFNLNTVLRVPRHTWCNGCHDGFERIDLGRE